MSTPLVGSQPLDHLAPVGGMDYTTAAHLLQPNQWRQVSNARMYGGALQQLALQYQVATLPANLVTLANIPTGAAEYGYWIGLTATDVLQLRKSLTSGDHLVLKSGLNDCGKLWGTYVHNGCLFFTNDSNQVRYCDGGSVRDLWDGFQSMTVPATVDKEVEDSVAECGPFTKQPFFVGTEHDEPSGFIDPTFTWTTSTPYRVYVQNPRLFTMGMSVSIERLGVALTGMITQVLSQYIIVLATNTVAAVVNRYSVGSTPETIVWNTANWIVRIVQAPGIPSGRYVTIFFDHCVVAAPPTNRNLIKWSGLYNYMRWTPSSDCEADSRQCTDYQRADDIVQGVTGVQHYKEILMVFTPSCIYAMQYVGLPRIIRIEPLVKDYGNGLPYATAELDDRVVWCDVHHRSFYAWRGQGPEDIGGPIAEWFFTRLSTTSAYAAKTVAVVDRANHEVAWWYVANAGTDYNEAVVYNWASNVWSVRDLTNGERCFGRVYKRAKTTNELVGTINAQTGVCDALEQSSDALSAITGTSSAKLFNEGSGLSITPAAQPQLLFETGDLLYGSATRVKEVHTMTLHVSGTFTGIDVFVCGRERISTTVLYGTKVGTWTNSLDTKHLTFKPVTGKVLRYKFVVASGASGVVFHGYTDNITNADAIR